LPLNRPAPPFAGCGPIAVVVPRELEGLPPAEASLLARLPLQLATESDALARELGAPVVVVDTLPESGPAWVIGPASLSPELRSLGLPAADAPVLHLDRSRPLLVSDAPDLAGVLQTFSGLRSLARHRGGPLPVDNCVSVDEAIERVLVEVHDTWPGFALRGLDWTEISRRHVWSVRGAINPVAAMQRWLAELQDFHTWVRPARTQLVLPYGARVNGSEVVLTHVLPWTPAWALGVRPGYRLVGEDVQGAWASTPGAPHAKPLLVARRLLSGDAGQTRALEARGPDGHWVRWEETFEPPTGTPAAWEILPSGNGFLWVGAWIPGYGVQEVIDEAFEELQGCPGLIVDLRGNGGGRLAMAHAFRDRFLDRARQVGWIRSTEPGGRLGPAVPLHAEPGEQIRWHKPVRFLTSPLSYSSSEDALLGLQGEPNIEVVGERSGGGSGRIRRMRLFPGWRLTISSALTYDLRGHCIEGNGIPVDRPVHVDRARPTGGDIVFQVADGTSW
jgi:carboxyl-terminal processing protease